MTTTIRQMTADDLGAFLRSIYTAFGAGVTDEDLERERPLFEADRSFACDDGNRIAATIQGITFELTLPGLTTVAAGGITSVGVLPTHRRRGLLRALMARELDDMRGRGEPLAILQASESTIYGRFGFGTATFETYLEIDRRHADFATTIVPDGRLRLLDADEAATVVPAVYDTARRRQPGALNRSPARWRALLRGNPARSDAAVPRLVVAYESASGQAEGIARYRVREQYNNGLPNGVVRLRELIALTGPAYTTLWRYCLSIDLTTTVQAQDRPVDEPLRWQLADPRRLRVTRIMDDLWVRVLDVPTALSARRYAVEGRIVLAVTDPFIPDNSARYVLDGSPEGATCRRTDAEPDLSLDIADLGATYLGGVRFGTLVRAGRVTAHRDDAVRRADALFTCDPPPHNGTSF